MASRIFRFLYVSIIFSFPFYGDAQDLSQVGKENPISISGGLSVNQVFYASLGLDNRRDPYNYYLGGQIALDIYGLSLPFSFTYSNQQSQFRQPFNQFSLHPTYKWATGHFGYTSVSYSPYTLNGHIFEGAAIDLKPTDKWEIGLMYGRLQKAVLKDTTDTNSLPSSYKRMGYSLKVKYGDQLNYVQIILFKSLDDATSLISELIEEEIKPEENLVASFGFSKQLFDKLVLQVEYASSALTRDITASSINSDEPLTKFGMFTPRVSSAYYSAYNTSINYVEKVYSVGLKYERVGADYQTHGAYYFNNDFYNLSVNGNLNMLRGKAKLTGSLGIQEDNLEKTKVSGSKRMVGSMALGMSASEKLNFNLGYSNYTTFTNINNDYLDLAYLTPYDRLDTLNYSQVAQNATLGFNYVLSRRKDVQQSLIGNLTLMQTKDEQAEILQPTSSNFLTFNGGYMHSVVPIGLNFSAMLNMQRNADPNVNTNVIGPLLTVSKLFLNKNLRSSISGAYNRVTTGATFGSTINTRLLLSYKLKKSHNFQLSLISVQRQRKAEAITKTSEVTGTIGYNYSFR
ncbi:MAG: hypothetical protein ABFS32_05830 [Bacteroidota bacterium]